jgi:large subunit ribosomal protein L18
MTKTLRTHELRNRRHRRVRKHVIGTADRPRLTVFRSNKHIAAQIIDDGTGRTLVAASTLEAPLRARATGNIAAAAEIGKLVADRAREHGVTKVVFDRGSSRYHGRVAALAEAARKAGLEL